MKSSILRWGLGVVLALVTVLALPALAQRGGGRFRSVPSGAANVPYNGEFTIVRLTYARYPGWSYDYPEMEQNFTLILNDISGLRARTDGSNILRMDDPELLNYPIA